MRVVVFRHDPTVGLGLVEPALLERRIEIICADLYADGAAPPETSEAGGLIFLGGPMSANDPLQYLECEMRIMREAAARGQPMLGICLGAQLLAKAFGAQVRRSPRPEIGWFEVRLTDAGAADPILGAMGRAETVLEWHRDTFDLPEGAVWLAWSDRCADQAFRIDRNIYGFQFHLEATPEIISDWCAQEAGCREGGEPDAPIDPYLDRERLAELAGEVFGRWLNSLKRQ
jgi:GMP synthase (glutamine-hydrolysing)